MLMTSFAQPFIKMTIRTLLKACSAHDLLVHPLMEGPSLMYDPAPMYGLMQGEFCHPKPVCLELQAYR